MTETIAELLGDYTDRFDAGEIVERIAKQMGGTKKQLDVEMPPREAEELKKAFRAEFPGILNFLIKNRLLQPKGTL